MALFNEINVGRYNAILHKLLGMKEGAPSPQVSGDVFPVLGLEMDRPEWKFLGGERLAYSGSYLAAVASKYHQTWLWNPPGSGALCVVEHLDASVHGSGGLVGLRDHNVEPSGASKTAVSSVARDYRYGIVATSIGFYYQTELALVGTRRLVSSTTASARYDLPGPIVLPPGYGVGFGTEAVNQILSANAFWRERPLEASETR